MTEEKHEKGRELLMLLRRRGQSLTRAIENDGGRGGRAEIRIAVIQAVIGEARADGMEIIVALTQRIGEGLETVDFNVAGGGEAVNPRVEHFWLVNRERFIRAIGGQYARDQTRRGDCLVTGQIVSGIVGSAQRGHLEFREDAVRVKLVGSQHFAGAIPNVLGIGGVQQVVNLEVALQLQMGPVIQRIPQRVRNGAGPCQELRVWLGVAGDELLRYAVGPHGAPLVVIALQPNLKQVLELSIGRDVLRRQMAVVVENRLVFSEAVIKAARRLIVQ